MVLTSNATKTAQRYAACPELLLESIDMCLDAREQSLVMEGTPRQLNKCRYPDRSKTQKATGHDLCYMLESYDLCREGTR